MNALGHCMRKALSLVWGVWRNGADFDPVGHGLDKTLWGERLGADPAAAHAHGRAPCGRPVARSHSWRTNRVWSSPVMIST